MYSFLRYFITPSAATCKWIVAEFFSHEQNRINGLQPNSISSRSSFYIMSSMFRFLRPGNKFNRFSLTTNSSFSRHDRHYGFLFLVTCDVPLLESQFLSDSKKNLTNFLSLFSLIGRHDEWINKCALVVDLDVHAVYCTAWIGPKGKNLCRGNIRMQPNECF